jgi:formyl-CoA transferase
MGSAHRLQAPYQALRASDGYFTVGAGVPHLWERFCRVMGLSDLFEDPAYKTGSGRVANRARLEEDIERVTMTGLSTERGNLLPRC